jgi:hypothetical protein
MPIPRPVRPYHRSRVEPAFTSWLSLVVQQSIQLALSNVRPCVAKRTPSGNKSVWMLYGYDAVPYVEVLERLDAVLVSRTITPQRAYIWLRRP